MRTAVSGAAVGLVALTVLARPQPRSAPAAPNAVDRLAAESLVHSAVSLLHSPRAPGQAGTRAVALCRLARRLDPHNLHAARLLTDLYEGRGDYVAAVDPAEAYLQRRPDDHAFGRRWLALRLAGLQRAAPRAELLRRVVAREDYPAPLRAAAAAEHAALLRGQGRTREARHLYETALRKWDPLDPHALKGALALRKSAAPADVADTRLKLLEGNPYAVDVAWRLAVLLDELALHRQAVEFFDYVWQVARLKGAGDQVSGEFVAQYCNAMLNAGRYEQAVAKFQPAQRRFADRLDLPALLAEAYRALGREKQARQCIAAMADVLEAKEATAGTSVRDAEDLAMFYLVSRPSPARALAFARLAVRLRPQDPVALRLLGAAELASGDEALAARGRRRLENVADRDLYAAAFLAEHLFAVGEAAAGKKRVASALSGGGSGPALRRLRALAAEHKLLVPAPPGQHEVAKRLAGFDRAVLSTGLHPEKHLAVALRAAKGRVPGGEPLVVEATLTNTSGRRLRLGDWGLLNPRLELAVRVAGGAATQPSAAGRRLVRWPAPAYLQPGMTLRVRARLDVGPVAAALVQRPLDELTLVVEPTLDPYQDGKALKSWVPTVPVAGVRIVRAPLLAAGAASRPASAERAYRALLLDLTRAIKRGPPAQRMRAARQVGSLLTLVRRVEGGRDRLPGALAGVVTKPMLLSMTRALLHDPAPCVRAEMLAALGSVDLDVHVLRLLGGAIQDPRSLVRLRLVELLGASASPGNRTIVDYMARDEDALVRVMASAFAAGGGRD